MAVASALEQTAEVSKVEIFYQLKAVLSDEELTLVGDFLEDCGQNREGRFSVSRFFRDMPAFQERGSTIQKHEIVDLLEQVGFLRLDRSIGPMVSASYFSPRTERYKGVLA